MSCQGGGEGNLPESRQVVQKRTATTTDTVILVSEGKQIQTPTPDLWTLPIQLCVCWKPKQVEIGVVIAI